MSSASDQAAPVEKFRKDYAPTPYAISEIELDFSLHDGETAESRATTVTSRLHVSRRPGADAGASLDLDGEDLELVSLAVDGVELTPGGGAYAVEGDVLSIDSSALPAGEAQFVLESVVRLAPAANLQLSGLYKSGGMFCTQCEAEGFRRITYYYDRPDVMATFSRVRLEAGKESYPVLLSNGNKLEHGDCGGGRHFAVWEDPYPKPSYLFALVAGDLGKVSGTFQTASGRQVELNVYSEKENVDQCDHALASLIKSMQWDEERFGLEYDLSLYNIVAVNDFNMGAMENKGLNIFNTALTLAKPSTATDDNYERIESVIGHEYFHNWSGNRVTCRDWFQLTLKEGLTVFRDQEFSSDVGSRPVVRIENVKSVRGRQFIEDAGPMSHPIRPESYIAMDNFYTSTVYEKGAEVIRMYMTFVGKDGFRRGLTEYFKRHDGAAVTCDDFRAAMADANGVDLAQFERWYTQAGTPVLTAAGAYDAAAGVYSLTLSQACPPTPGQAAKEPFHIPVVVGLLDAESGAEVVASRTLELREASQTFTFDGLPAPVVPSILRGFSAPVKLVHEPALTDDTLAFLAAHDTDAFNRWEAGQALGAKLVLDTASAFAAAGGAKPDAAVELPAPFLAAFRSTLSDASLDPSLRAYALVLPPLSELSQAMAVIDPTNLPAARRAVRRSLALACQQELVALYDSLAPPPGAPFSVDGAEIGRRRLRNCALGYLCSLPDGSPGGRDAVARAKAQFDASAGCMTDRLAAFSCLVGKPDDSPAAAERAAAVAAFHEAAGGDALVVNKWFMTQATADRAGLLDDVKALVQHPDFSWTNPNRLRSVVSAFASSMEHFHAPGGAAYAWLGDAIEKVDKINPQVASRLAGAFALHKRYDAERGELMRAQLSRIKALPGLSKDTFEVCARSLA